MDNSRPTTHFRLAGGPSYSKAHEEYLRLIYEKSGLPCESPVSVSTNEIAKSLAVAPASVTNMIKKLASCNPPLLDYQKHKGVTLTSRGEILVLEVIRNHRLLELFLHKIMGFPWDAVHREALGLQHAISPEFVSRMSALLNNPSFDPHGSPIPNQDLQMPPFESRSLAEFSEGERVIIISVPDNDPELLREFAKNSVLPQACITIGQRSSYDGTTILLSETEPSKKMAVSAEVARHIRVRRAIRPAQ